ncbi:UPF0692 protein C19orf54 homolog [Daphnia pulex]|uniref:UPF0692 protein C19orf54 homolog n=1 Tax=Daphnia pulex TaxID=6669 RepID=UPI001EDD0F88|nr:UPF0692 protein C19orf54 homolog [Daphnia pulex]
MAAQSCGIKVDTDSIFQQAKQMGITKKGELFSSSAVCALANQMNINSVLLNNGFSNIQLLLRYFISGKLLLVPYDADCNHAPCLKKGHKAHWALLVGVFFEFENNLNLHTEFCCKREILGEDLYRISDLSANCDLLSQVKKENIYFLAKHGKSKRLAIWNCESLQLSNNNLEEVDPKRSNSIEYVLPPNNKLSDLCGKIIVLG